MKKCMWYSNLKEDLVCSECNHRMYRLLLSEFNDTGQNSHQFFPRKGNHFSNMSAPHHDLTNMKSTDDKNALPKYRISKDASTKKTNKARRRYYKKNQKDAPIGISNQVY